MERVFIQSSNLVSVGYDPETEMLEVEFLSGSIYEYKNVPQVVYEEFMSASSHGSYFNKQISRNYSYEKIG